MGMPLSIPCSFLIVPIVHLIFGKGLKPGGASGLRTNGSTIGKSTIGRRFKDVCMSGQKELGYVSKPILDSLFYVSDLAKVHIMQTLPPFKVYTLTQCDVPQGQR
jgi:hypothetical protein